MQEGHSDSPGSAQHAMVLGSGASVIPNAHCIALIHRIQWTIRSVQTSPPNDKPTGRLVPLCTRLVVHHTFFLSRHVIASFSFGARSVQTEICESF